MSTYEWLRDMYISKNTQENMTEYSLEAIEFAQKAEGEIEIFRYRKYNQNEDGQGEEKDDYR
jgi:hypothetical protein